jgi:hypothetical protein
MPNIMFQNTTNDTAYIRVYTPEAYLVRSRMLDRYYHSFTQAPNSYQVYVDHTYEMIFKAQLLGQPALASGNITIAKRAHFDDPTWRASGAAVTIDIDLVHNAVRLG